MPEEPETKVCKYCGVTLVKMVSWVHMTGAVNANPMPSIAWGAPLCIHEPAAEGEKPSGQPRTAIYLGGH